MVVQRYKEFQSYETFKLEQRAPGVYLAPHLIEGNSLLSTLFIESIDPGATVFVEWYDTTTGDLVGEEYALKDHAIGSVAGFEDRILVTKIHNKPFCRATVAGGNATFSIYITIVNSTASDIDSALVLHEQIANLLRDKGIPTVGYDPIDGRFYFLEVDEGRLIIAGEVQTTIKLINHRLYDQQLALAPYTPTTAITYTVPTGKKFTWLAGHGAADQKVRWDVTIAGVKWLTKYNAFDSPNPVLFPGNPVVLTSGEVLEVTVENKTPYGDDAEIETFIFGSEEDA